MSTLKISNIANLSGTSTSVENVLNGTAKAWVNFNGTGTVAIRASYNVSSITDNGVGNYTVNLSSAMSNINCSISVTSGDASGGGAYHGGGVNLVTTSTVGVKTNRTDTGADIDRDFISVAILR